MFAQRIGLTVAIALLGRIDGGWAEHNRRNRPFAASSRWAPSFMGYGGDPVNTLEPLNAKPGIFGGLVIISTWRQLQHEPNGEIPDNNPIDKALADVRAYNAKNPQKPLAVKVRIFAGIEAPAWAMKIGGEPIATIHNGKKRVIGRFWSPEYRRAWTQFQRKLAAKYDSRPLIHEVAMTSCYHTADPLHPRRPHGESVARGGFQGCRISRVPNTRLPTTHHGKPHGSASRSIHTTASPPRAIRNSIAIMQACRKAIGKQCVFDNHDLDADTPKTILPLHAAMQRMGPEIQFQTLHATPPNWEGTIKRGVALGASSIELWQDYGGFPQVPDATLKRWAAMLEANKSR
jgi:hypothetical protein